MLPCVYIDRKLYTDYYVLHSLTNCSPNLTVGGTLVPMDTLGIVGSVSSLALCDSRSVFVDGRPLPKSQAQKTGRAWTPPIKNS